MKMVLPVPVTIRYFFTTMAEPVKSHQFWINQDWCSHRAVNVGQVMFICCSLMYLLIVLSFYSMSKVCSLLSNVSNATFVSFLQLCSLFLLRKKKVLVKIQLERTARYCLHVTVLNVWVLYGVFKHPCISNVFVLPKTIYKMKQVLCIL